MTTRSRWLHGHLRVPLDGQCECCQPRRAEATLPALEEGQQRHRAREPYAGRLLGEVAVCAGRTDTFLGERYRRIARRRGKKKAIVAVGRSVLVIIWHLLSNPELRYQDLGAGFFTTRIDRDRKTLHRTRQLQAMGYQVTLEPVA